MHLEERMIQAPCRCMNCGTGNTPDGDTGIIGPFIDLETDVNWGDAAYLCMDCATKIGALSGMASKQDVADLRLQIKARDKEIHDLKAEMEIRRRRERHHKERADAVQVLTR